MSKSSYNDWAKDLFYEVMAPLGHVGRETPIAGNVRYADLIFEPASRAAEATGLLAKLMQRSALVEFFQEPPSDEDMAACFVKFINWLAAPRREEPSGLPSKAESEARWLWVVTPTASKAFLQRYNATPDPDTTSFAGVYRVSYMGLNVFIVVVHELPEIPETLVFRLVGHGEVQRRALVELAEPENDALRQSIQSSSELLDDAQKELLMNAQPLLDEYERMERRLRAEGKAEGLLMVLEARGFSPSDVVRQRIQKCTDASELKHWFRRAVQISSIDELFA